MVRASISFLSLKLTFPCSRDRIQQSGKTQGGEAEMDNLCSQFKAKAKCTGKGAVIHHKDVDEILKSTPSEQIDVLKMFTPQ